MICANWVMQYILKKKNKQKQVIKPNIDLLLKKLLGVKINKSKDNNINKFVNHNNYNLKNYNN